jgi:hypothetical protein
LLPFQWNFLLVQHFQLQPGRHFEFRNELELRLQLRLGFLQELFLLKAVAQFELLLAFALEFLQLSLQFFLLLGANMQSNKLV